MPDLFQPDILVSFASRHWVSAVWVAAILFLAGMNTLLFRNIRRRSDALRESQLLLNKTFASLRDSLLIIDAEKRVVLDCNPATAKLFGYSRDEVVGQSVRLLHIDDAAFLRFGEMIQIAVKENGYLHVPAFRMRRKNGESFDTQHSVMPLYAEDGSLMSIVSVIRDITEQKKTEAKLDQYRRKLRALAAELSAVEARERRAIAAQLHENLGQLLATAKIKVATVKSAVADPDLGQGIGEVQLLVEEALQQTRSLTYQLSPPILYQLGLEAALKWLSENMERQHGFRVVFSRQGESRNLAEESRAFLFSAIRELLVNVAKHSGAGHVAVRVRWCAESVEILVADNGQGFRTHDAFGAANGFPESHDGFGLFNIQERVSDLGGRLRIRSEPAKGTAVKIYLPLGAADRFVETTV
ncbi:MAG TPA: PAS domain S-box protein [Bryobacteraceae bacterium]|nr:PAS domain S-box protein [Bryobacteraceae bacterium]